MAIDKESLKKMFPNLYRELEARENSVSISAVRNNAKEEESVYAESCENIEKIPSEKPSDKLRNYNPAAVDFIRRCDTEIQAEEIIAYLQRKGEITDEYAKDLRCKLKMNGVRSFGSKKEDYYYFREGGIY
jgi:hypothetical protein